MYSHPVLIGFISVLVVGGLALYLAHWLVTAHRAIYERFFGLIVGAVLLLNRIAQPRRNHLRMNGWGA